MEVNYIFILLAVAFLWRPSETAKEYAYVMELNSTNEGEFEMADVPSAMDDDDDDDEEGVVFQKEEGGFKDEPDESWVHERPHYYFPSILTQLHKLNLTIASKEDFFDKKQLLIIIKNI